MDAPALLVLGDEATADAVEAAVSEDGEVAVRRVGDVDALFRALCDDVVSALLLPRHFDGTSGDHVARGVHGLYPDLPVVIAGGEAHDGAGAPDGDETGGGEASPDAVETGNGVETPGASGATGPPRDDEVPGIVRVDAASMADERAVAAVEAALSTDVDSDATRPPSRLETLAMSMFDGFTDHLYAKDDACRHVLTGSETFGLGAVVGRTDRAIDDGVAESMRTSLADDHHVVTTGDPVVDREEFIAGENEYALTTKVPWYDADGSVVGLVGISRDISDRKRQERALRRQNERLTKIAVVAAHELRNELQVAAGRLPLLREDPGQFEVVDGSLDRLETIVDDVVTLASAQRRSVDEETEWLSTPAREVWQSLDAADATLDVAPDRTVVADPRSLRLLLEILLSNAVEHGGSGVSVVVGGTADGFYVSDDGAGIEFDPPERVFDAGFARAGNDAGFGLYVAQRIATDHGWTLDVADGPDGGARFDVCGVSGRRSDGCSVSDR